jgi:hypothetical protein
MSHAGMRRGWAKETGDASRLTDSTLERRRKIYTYISHFSAFSVSSFLTGAFVEESGKGGESSSGSEQRIFVRSELNLRNSTVLQSDDFTIRTGSSRDPRDNLASSLRSTFRSKPLARSHCARNRGHLSVAGLRDSRISGSGESNRTPYIHERIDLFYSISFREKKRKGDPYNYNKHVVKYEVDLFFFLFTHFRGGAARRLPAEGRGII